MPLDEYCVALAVYSPTRDAAELTALIGMDPDEAFSKGDTLRSGRTRSRSMVRFGSGLPRSADAPKQVHAVLRRVADCASQIRSVSEEPDSEVTLSIGYFVNEPQWQESEAGFLVRGLGVALEPADVTALHALGAAFAVDSTSTRRRRNRPRLLL